MPGPDIDPATFRTRVNSPPPPFRHPPDPPTRASAHSTKCRRGTLSYSTAARVDNKSQYTSPKQVTIITTTTTIPPPPPPPPLMIWNSVPRREKFISSPKRPPALASTQSLSQWVPGGFSMGV